MCATIPSRTQSKTIAQLIEQEVASKENHLLECAQQVEDITVAHYKEDSLEVEKTEYIFEGTPFKVNNIVE